MSFPQRLSNRCAHLLLPLFIHINIHLQVLYINAFYNLLCLTRGSKYCLRSLVSLCIDIISYNSTPSRIRTATTFAQHDSDEQFIQASGCSSSSAYRSNIRQIIDIQVFTSNFYHISWIVGYRHSHKGWLQSLKVVDAIFITNLLSSSIKEGYRFRLKDTEILPA